MSAMTSELAPVLQRVRRPDDWLVNQLPVGMLDDDFFVRFVRIFQAMASTLLDDVDNLENILDVTVAPTPIVRWMGTWLGVDDVDSALPDELQRAIVRTTGQTLAWRGTRRGLVSFLEMITGDDVIVADTGGVYAQGEAPDAVPTVRVEVVSTGWVPPEDFVRLVRREIPIHLEVELVVGGALIWPPPTPVTEAVPVVGPATGSTPVSETETETETETDADRGEQP